MRGWTSTPAEVDARFLGRSLASTRAILASDFGLTLTDEALAAMRRRLYAAFRAELRPIPGIAETLDALACRILRRLILAARSGSSSR